MANIIAVDDDLAINLGMELLDHGFEIGYGLRHLTLSQEVFRKGAIVVYQPWGGRQLPIDVIFGGIGDVLRQVLMWDNPNQPELIGVIDLNDDMYWKVFHFNHHKVGRLADFLQEFVTDDVTVTFKALGTKTYKAGDFHPLANFGSETDRLVGY